MRRDIQALRALAVTLVIVYHFWPDALPGGFVGVDVFFVISGFLITTHLLQRPPGTVRELGTFWARRIRRLLPASLTVLAVTVVATVLWVPSMLWESIAKHAAAAAFYVENWALAGDAVDYSANASASPVQHFWSLSVEEQFYLVWPLLIVLAGVIAMRRGKSLRRVATLLIAAVVLASLVASVVLTTTDGAAAYFVSWTRAWELGAGGLLACVIPVIARWALPRFLRRVIVLLGAAAIVFAAISFSSATAFPGVAALLPVLGTVLIIAADAPAGRLVSSSPVQWVGEASYSIYLWHWPVLVLAPYVLGRELNAIDTVAALLSSLVLAALGKRWVEDRFRAPGALRRSYGFALLGALVIGAAAFTLSAGAGVAYAAAKEQTSRAVAAAASTSESGCLGGDALMDPDCSPHGDELLTDPVVAAKDRPAPYEDECWTLGSLESRTTCEYGSDDPNAVRVALVGNSHAGQWLPALQEIAKRKNWHVTTHLITVCYTVDAPIVMDTPERSENCRKWNRETIDEIRAGDYDLVVTSNRTSTRQPIKGESKETTGDVAREAYRDTLNAWLDAGIPVLVLRDTPAATDLTDVPGCVALNREDVSQCDAEAARRQVRDPLAEAAKNLENEGRPVAVTDLTDRICAGRTCYGVVGGVVVYFDAEHLSQTFVRTLYRPIEDSAENLLAR